jgi:hypothetical protein
VDETVGHSRSRVVTYAEALTPDHPQYKIWQAGKRPDPPGQLLGDILKQTGGKYQFKTLLWTGLYEEIEHLAELTGDPDLAAAAEKETWIISLEHLRGLPPETRVVVGIALEYSEEDQQRFHVKPPPFDPDDAVPI